MRVLKRSDFERLFSAFRNRKYQIVGPTIRDGAIVYDQLDSASQLPSGWSDEQDGGNYRLKKRKDEALFAYNSAAYSWKKFLHPPRELLWKATRNGKLVTISQPAAEPPKLVLFGVRSCDLHAIEIQGRVLAAGSYADSAYARRRQNAFIVAVNCTHAGGTCFCASMNAGPRATSGFDLAITEIVERDRPSYTIEAASQAGHEIISELGLRPATIAESAAAAQAIERAAAHMGRKIDNAGIIELLYKNYEHPRWDNAASRCLNCANCTMVCPTCFCTTVDDVTDLIGKRTERIQVWDSCFTTQFSYIHGGSIRPSARSRYRQWMTHKLATWYDQFGTSGCVGCGRCITWCPVAIDITEEVQAIRDTDLRKTTRKANHGITGTVPA